MFAVGVHDADRPARRPAARAKQIADTSPHSAHSVSPYEAFSTLQPITMLPSSTSAAAPPGTSSRARRPSGRGSGLGPQLVPVDGRPRSLLLDVGLAVGGGRAGAAHEAGDHEDRDDVRRHQQELGRDRHVEDRQLSLQRLGEAEHQGGPKAPTGFQRPKIIAARAMKPRPAVMFSSNRPPTRV